MRFRQFITYTKSKLKSKKKVPAPQVCVPCTKEDDTNKRSQMKGTQDPLLLRSPFQTAAKMFSILHLYSEEGGLKAPHVQQKSKRQGGEIGR